MDEEYFFLKLRDFVKDKISAYELRDSDPSIEYFSEKNPKGESILTISFPDGDKVLSSVGVSDDDIYTYRAVRSGNFSPIDSYTVEEDFKEGYGPYYYFNDENIELVKKISLMIIPIPFDLDDDEFKKSFSNKLHDLFNRQYDRIIDAYTECKNNEISQSLEESIDKDLEEVEKDFGFEIIDSDTIKITVGDLYANYAKYNSYMLSIEGLFDQMAKENEYSIGGWWENVYEYQNDKYFNKEYFNREVNWSLEQVYDKLTEDYTEEELKKYLELIDRISNKFKINTWYKVPKSEIYAFKIDGFDLETKKIVISIMDSETKRTKRVKLDEENFNNLLYQPELFKLEI